ncbi:hypothetical protein FH972_022876 [Carpinus fangiana]|uniref:NADH:ubiquinone reductase (non-electrogenic) n=1 Tax=Carpinus fangiana TaxID=176857 RepID=A0A5N6KTW2_9ROSI|nr:hypothetical protein FH972_022876 [Carpinus fangiana]
MKPNTQSVLRCTSRLSRHAASRSSKRTLINSASRLSLRHRAPSQTQSRGLTIADLDKSKGDRERVVILGSGWAGYPLARTLDPKKFQAVIVSPRSYFVFTPLLASTSVGTLEFRTALEPIRSRRSKARYIQGWADDVDFFNKTVTVEEAVADPNQGLALTGPRYEGKTEEEVVNVLQSKKIKGQVFNLSYDKLAIAVGCYSQTFNIPGVREHAHFLKDVGDARAIRKRLLECFEAAALPTTPDTVRRQLLTFAIVGGGPTGIEFSAELHDLCTEEMSRIYPELAEFVSITVYDVAPKVLGMFDDKLAKYAADTFKREGIAIKTSHHVENITRGLPGVEYSPASTRPGLTLKVKEEGEMGVGMVVWSTGLQMNPFVERALSTVRRFPRKEVIFKAQDQEVTDAEAKTWTIARDGRSGGLLTNDRLRVMLESNSSSGNGETRKRAFMKDVFAIGDCGVVEGTAYPATAQVANQKALYLGKRLNRNDMQQQRFTWKNLGIMAYLGNWRALVQGGSGFGNISGRTAWIIWRGAYLMMALSWKNRILIPVYWVINWIFGRDISRF